MRAQALGLMRIVSDDLDPVWTCEGRLFGACPLAIRGLLEARGLGLVPFADRPLSEIRLLVSCRTPGEPIERLPDPEERRMLGVRLPVLRLHARLALLAHLHPRPQHGGRARPVARDRDEGRRFRQADHRDRQQLHPVRARATSI